MEELVYPKISVIMGIYNCSKTLPEAIKSILNQTVTDWELIMCDDGSKDSTYSIAEKYRDIYPSKIVLLKNEYNKGLNYTLNTCLQIAKGQYIARMDGDDICSPERFEKELRVFERHPEMAIVSTAMECFDESGVWGCITHPRYVGYKDFLYGTPFCHASCMIRKDAIISVGGYSESKWLLRVEDYHLWVKMYVAGFKGMNIDKPLYQMRDDRNAYQRRKFRYRLNEAYVIILAIKELRLPIYGFIYALKPIIVGLLPNGLYDLLHKRNLRRRK